jgi:hypothetical protein
VVHVNTTLWHFRLVGAIALAAAGTMSAGAQTSANASTSLIVRQQLGSIAEEVVGKLGLPDGSGVILEIQPEAKGDLAANAFLEVLQHRGYRGFLHGANDSAAAKLDLNLLTQSARFDEIGTNTFLRTIQTGVEARIEVPAQNRASVLGMFHRSERDTVSQRDADLTMVSVRNTNGEDVSLLQRVVAPLIVLTSGILVVYLFFTVRS